MKFKKVVYVRYMPLTKAIYTDLYFEELLQNGIEVAYLDITALFFQDKTTSDEFGFERTVKIGSYNELKDYLKAQDNVNTLYISIMTFEGRVFKLFRLFTKLDLKLGVFSRGVFPGGAEPDKRSKIVQIIQKLSFGRVTAYTSNKLALLAKRKGYIKSYDYIFSAGEYGYYGLGIGSDVDFRTAQIVQVNTVDYDRFIQHRDLPSVHTGKYIVFLDQYLPYHPDASYFNIKTVEPEPYFREVNSFFDRLEKQTGMNVVIAAHPKADKYKEFNPYNGRSVLFNQSSDLVKDASLVLTHASTAICFPICYKKQLVLMVSEYLNRVLPQFLILANSIRLACGATIISIDKSDDEIPTNDEINLIDYNDYLYKYLTSEQSKNQLSKDVYINFFK